jgi:hypothetical protein
VRGERRAHRDQNRGLHKNWTMNGGVDAQLSVEPAERTRRRPQPCA